MPYIHAVTLGTLQRGSTVVTFCGPLSTHVVSFIQHPRAQKEAGLSQQPAAALPAAWLAYLQCASAPAHLGISSCIGCIQRPDDPHAQPAAAVSTQARLHTWGQAGCCAAVGVTLPHAPSGTQDRWAVQHSCCNMRLCQPVPQLVPCIQPVLHHTGAPG